MISVECHDINDDTCSHMMISDSVGESRYIQLVVPINAPSNVPSYIATVTSNYKYNFASDAGSNENQYVKYGDRWTYI